MRLLVLVVKNTLNRINHLKDIYLFVMIVCRSKMAHNTEIYAIRNTLNNQSGGGIGRRMSSLLTKKQDINMIQENENQKDTDMHLVNKRASAATQNYTT
jgi:hypothetical protein